jgi:hypothetical protein
MNLLHALDQKVWEVNDATMTESPNYETLTIDELFSKLKSIEIYLQSRAKIENPSSPIMALVSGLGGCLTNSDPHLCVLHYHLSCPS